MNRHFGGSDEADRKKIAFTDGPSAGTRGVKRRDEQVQLNSRRSQDDIRTRGKWRRYYYSTSFDQS